MQGLATRNESWSLQRTAECTTWDRDWYLSGATVPSRLGPAKLAGKLPAIFLWFPNRCSAGHVTGAAARDAADEATGPVASFSNSPADDKEATPLGPFYSYEPKDSGSGGWYSASCWRITRGSL